jgi:hypothetical protein
MECAGPSYDDEDAWYVVAQDATYQRREIDTVENVDDIMNCWVK